jgi:hypothetical protein
MIATTKKKLAAHLILAAMVMFAPLAYARDATQTQVAAAIGAEEEPVAKPPAPTNEQPKPAPETAAATPPESVEPSAGKGLSSAEIWLGVGVAAFLAAAGGGGGGGGSTTSH